MSTSSTPSCTLDLDNKLCIFQEEEKIRRENLQRIMEENQKKIEEQNKKMVIYFILSNVLWANAYLHLWRRKRD